MIENNNTSKMPSDGQFIDVKKYTGVASVSVLAVNPTNAVLRKYGWEISETADEQKYTYTKQAEDGSFENYAKVRFLLQINDFPEKPVIPYDIWIRQNYIIGKTSGKCRIIDSFGRCAWASKDEVKARAVPQYSNGPANISSDYKGCHPGQEKLIAFLFKYLNVTPLQMFDKKANTWIKSKAPGKLTIDKWNDLMEGNAEELAEYLALQPENRVKIILGVKTTDDNKTYQVILDDCDGATKTSFIGNGAKPDMKSNEYDLARKRIDAYYEDEKSDKSVIFSAKPVTEFRTSASVVEEDNSPNAPTATEAPSFSAPETSDDDLPF